MLVICCRTSCDDSRTVFAIFVSSCDPVFDVWRASSAGCEWIPVDQEAAGLESGLGSRSAGPRRVHGQVIGGHPVAAQPTWPTRGKWAGRSLGRGRCAMTMTYNASRLVGKIECSMAGQFPSSAESSRCRQMSALFLSLLSSHCFDPFFSDTTSV